MRTHFQIGIRIDDLGQCVEFRCPHARHDIKVDVVLDGNGISANRIFSDTVVDVSMELDTWFAINVVKYNWGQPADSWVCRCGQIGRPATLGSTGDIKIS